MARGRLVAALGAVALAIAAPIAARAGDHATVEPSGLIHWPAAGDWQTLLMKLPNGQPACIFGPKERTLPDGGKFGRAGVTAAVARFKSVERNSAFS